MSDRTHIALAILCFFTILWWATTYTPHLLQP